jgi:N-dimethylarginine dimethylaminohydrolase
MTTSNPTILMCAPEYYGIEYEINPWMNQQRQADHELAVQQWNAFRDILRSLGVTVEQLEPVAGLPDLVFTANAALIYGNRAIISRFRHPQRQGEEEHDQRWLAEHGFHVECLAEDLYFEGAGDALFCGRTLLAGYRTRSHARAHQAVGRALGCRVLPMELIDSYYYHLDTCFCPLDPETAIFYPGAFDAYGRQALDFAVSTLIAVEREEARSFACNAVVVGRNVITNTGCTGLHRSLKQAGYHALETPLSEFVKAGGSAKCLTLRLDGEEAAGWKYHEETADSPDD